MNSNEIIYFKELLENEKKKVSNIIEMMEKNQSAKYDSFTTSELSNYDNHPADIASEVYEVEKNTALRNDSIRKLHLIENALKKIEHGNFGICDYCQKEIEKERLEVIPYAKFCINCEKEYEKNSNNNENQRPSEEKVMGKPFNDKFVSQSSEEEYNGIDMWSIISTHATSDGPQDNTDFNSISYYKSVNEINDKVEEIDSISNKDQKRFLEGI